MKSPLTVSVPGELPGATVPPVFMTERTVPVPFSVPPVIVSGRSSVAPEATRVRPPVCVTEPALAGAPIGPACTSMVPAFSMGAVTSNVFFTGAWRMIVEPTRLRRTPVPPPLLRSASGWPPYPPCPCSSRW